MADQLALTLDATPPGTYRQRGTSSLQGLFRTHFPELCARYETAYAVRLGRFVGKNPVGQFRIQVKHKEAVHTLPSPFELKRLLGSVSRHYQWLLGRRRAHRFSLFIHRRDLCIFSLCVACGLRRAELRAMSPRAK